MFQHLPTCTLSQFNVYYSANADMYALYCLFNNNGNNPMFISKDNILGEDISVSYKHN